MAIKEILDILGENPTESVYSEGKDFVTKKIKLYIDKKKLENYVKETYNRRTKVYASKKFAYEGFMVYISSKAFINEVEEILVETDYDKREKRKGELIAEGISYIEKSDTIAQEQAKELMLIGMEAVLKYLSEQIELSLRISINNQTDNIIYQVKKELNETIQKLIQELMPKKRKVKPCPVQPQNISNELIPPIEYVGSEKVPENEKYDYGKDDEKDSLYPMLRILKEHQECRFFQLEGIGAQTCGGVGKTYTLYGVMNQVNNAGKNPVVYLLLKKVYSGFSDGSRSENQLLAEVKKQLEEDECDKALLLLDGYNELPSITCQMNFILDIASYQEQYPNSTIVVASRTKMQYADAHAFVSGDADYASLEILNELKHCYILVLERAAIEKAIGAKIETQEEYETLSTPFYISLNIPAHSTAKSRSESSAPHSTVSMKMWCCPLSLICNAKFAEKGLDVRIDHRSYERQGVDLLPTIHEGATVRAMEKKGIRTEKGEFNRWIKATNAVIRDIKKKITSLMGWIADMKAELAKPQAPDLVSLLNAYYTQRKAGAYSQKGKISNLKEMNDTFNYLRANGIYSLEDLERRVSEHSAATESLKKTLDEQTARMKAIKQLYDSSAAFQSLKPVYDGLQKIKFEKPRAKYKAEHETELKQFYAARRKLTGEFPDGKVDMKKLTEEYDELEQAHETTYGEFKTVRDDLHRLWKVKSCVDTATRFNERAEEQKLQNRPQTRHKKEELSR